MKRINGLLTLFLVIFIHTQAVPPTLNYAGQVAVNGEAFNGQGLFKFALVHADGNASYWSNDERAEVRTPGSVSKCKRRLIFHFTGQYRNSRNERLDPAIFQQHPNLRLRVWFNDGENGFQQFSPDRPFASVPYALTAGDVSDSPSPNRLSPEVLGALNILPSIST